MTKMEPKGGQMKPNGAQMEPQGVQMEPQGGQMESQAAQTEPQGDQMESQGRQIEAKRRQMEDQRCPKRSATAFRLGGKTYGGCLQVPPKALFGVRRWSNFVASWEVAKVKSLKSACSETGSAA